MNRRLMALRRRLVSAPLARRLRRVLPPLSDTEREALEAGSVWWEGALFSGRPEWSAFLANPAPRLTEAEQAFLDGPVETLCRMLDDWRISHELVDLPPEVWRYIEEQGFFGMIIPREYGGLGFSALAHSAVVVKLTTRSITAAITVMVPNSLGPAELLLHYGTEAQKRHYLPRLARGEELPCFALTGPLAGSDAASLPDTGVVCHGEYRGERTLGLRVNWEKRYITLGPVATLLGLAFRARDPDHLLGETEDLGITLALVPTDTPGVNIGRRHFPARQAFQNGPNSGQDVFIPLDWVIGGREQVGQGWRMLMQSLSAGRCISLPAISTGAARFCARTTGAYARVRRQFGVPVGRFEGVQEPLARIAADAYLLDAARAIGAAAVDAGEKPAVVSAMLKYHFTERMRRSVNDAMDVHGGKAICDGPSNYLFGAYQNLPVAITVEGANILTRSLMIFGQGAVRCHPYLLAEMRALREDGPGEGIEAFDRALFGHARHLLGNLGRALVCNLGASRPAPAPAAAHAALHPYYRALGAASATFALVADAALLTLGGELKRREMLSGRLGDVLSELFLASCALKRFEDDGRPEADLPLVHWICQSALHTIQERLDAILANFPSRGLARLLRVIVFPYGRRRHPPGDELTMRCAELLTEPGPVRERLTAGIFVSTDPEDVTGRLEHALGAAVAAEPLEARLREAEADGRLAPGSTLESARAAGVLQEDEVRALREAREAVARVIAVEDFDADALARVPEQVPARARAVR